MLAAIEEAWDALLSTLDSLSDEQKTTVEDQVGWTVKDHLTHMAAWERSALYLLRGSPRHEALGVDEELYLSHDYDAINAVIKEQHGEESLDVAMSNLRATHDELMEMLESLTEEELLLPYSHYLPDEPGDGPGPPAAATVLGNTHGHFEEHREWILEMVEGPQ
jgi:hypothetical protein